MSDKTTTSEKNDHEKVEENATEKVTTKEHTEGGRPEVKETETTIEKKADETEK